MIGNKLKVIVGALTIGYTAISNTGCDADGGLRHLHTGSAAHYLAASDDASILQLGDTALAETAGTAHATHAEMRHFAIYNRYRAIIDSSGGSGFGSSYSSTDDVQIDFFPGSGLLEVEQFVCPDDRSKK